MQNGSDSGRSGEVPRDAGLVWSPSRGPWGGYLGSEARHQGLADQEQRVARPKSGRCETDNGSERDQHRDDPVRNSVVHGSSQGSEGLILGRLYRFLFGGIKGDAAKDDEVRAAYARVNKALEGLDQDVLTLMAETLKPTTALPLDD